MKRKKTMNRISSIVRRVRVRSLIETRNTIFDCVYIPKRTIIMRECEIEREREKKREE